MGVAHPGHPEYGHTAGVEVTTGPLGQGVGNGVGFAIAERLLADRYNRPDHELVDHRTWVFCGDGDMMEGVASEASSLAGHLGLGKLTLLYDDNHITIDGPTESPSPRTWPSGMRPTAGTSSTWKTPTTWRRSPPPTRPRSTRPTGPASSPCAA